VINWLGSYNAIMVFSPDKDFSQAEFTARGPFVRFRFKFDQNSIRDAAKWLGSYQEHLFINFPSIQQL
jgi:hypothetical protein